MHQPSLSTNRILVIDDEPDVTDLLAHRLTGEGYIVECINNPMKIMATARNFNPDLFILDIMMPGINGLQICQMLRSDPQYKDCLIVFLTAKGDPNDRINGFETGADEYIVKPFEMKELLLRIGLLFKRHSKSTTIADLILNVGSVSLNESLHEVTVNGRAIDLTPTEFRLLMILMKRKGRVQSRENLLVNVWNYDSETETRTIDTHIRRLREKLEEASDLIETVRGVGYRMLKG